MQLTIQRSDLNKAIQAVQRAVPSRGPLPVLANVKVKAAGGTLTLTGTDLELMLSAKTGSDVKRDGETLIPAKMFGEIVGKLPEGPVTIDTDGADTTIKAGRSKFKLRTQLPADYPDAPAPADDDPSAVFDAAALVAGLRHVTYTTAPDDKATICGILVEQTASGINLVATDGFKMSRYTLPGSGGEPWAVVVPRRAADEIARQLAGIDGEIMIRRSLTQLFMDAGSRSLATRLVDGTFPNYKLFIPDSFARTVTVDRLAFVEAVERVSVLASEMEAAVIQLDIQADAMSITAGASDRGDAEESVPVKLDGEPLKMALNSDFLVTMLKATAGDTVVLRLGGPLNPVVLSIDGRNAWLGLLMPVNKV